MADQQAARTVRGPPQHRRYDTMQTQANTIITSPALVKKVLGARTSEDIREIIDHAGREMTVAWRDLGDRDNNAGTVQIASSPAHAIIERVTNAQDGVIEM